MVTIIPFEEKYSVDFRALNLEWLREYFEVEVFDDHQLSHPAQEIIDKGGYIFLAKQDEKIVGTAALMKETDVSFELTKMSVTRDRQGNGISKMLMNACLQLAKEKNGIVSFFILIQNLPGQFNFIVGTGSLIFRWKQILIMPALISKWN